MTLPGKTPNALLHGALDALILKTLAARAVATATPWPAPSKTPPATPCSSRKARSIPALYRLERRGWVEAEWGTSELGRRAKLYRLTAGRPRAARRRAGHLAALLDRRVEGAVRVMRRSLRSWLWRVPVDQEVDEELAFHVEMRTRELRRGRDATRRRPAHRARPRSATWRRSNGPVSTWAESETARCASSNGSTSSGTTCVFALRQMRAAPAFTFVAALTLALGIGANSAIFALVDATLLRPLPFRDPEQRRGAGGAHAERSRSGVSPLNLSDWDAGSRR